MFQICGWVFLFKLKNNFIILLFATGHWCPPLIDRMVPRHGIMKAFPKVKRARVLQGKDTPPLKKKPDECDVTGSYCVCMCLRISGTNGRQRQQKIDKDLKTWINTVNTKVEARQCNTFACSNLFLSFASGNTFNGVTVYILPAGIGNARCQIFQKQIQQNGGQTENSLCPGVTHVVVDDNMDSDRALRLLKVDRMPSGVHLVKCTWLSLCISEKQLLDVASYSHLLPNRLIRYLFFCTRILMSESLS